MKIKLWIKSIFTVFLLFTLTVINVCGETYDSDNGLWESSYQVLRNTSEAQLMIRFGDIDNFGFPFKDKYNNDLDPFSGKKTKTHGYPFKPEGDDPLGTDTIMVVSGYSYGNWHIARDGYTAQTRRNAGSNYASNSVNPIHMSFNDEIGEIFIEDVYIQMFVDDYQPKKPGITQGFRGNNVYQCYFINDDGVRERVPELESIINNLNQHGPVGNMITFQVPERCLYLFREGNLKLEIDDKRSGVTGDGHAIDFVKLLINKKSFKYNANFQGVITDVDGTPLSGVRVSAGGVEGVTGNEGRYSLEGVPAGQVVVSVTKTGFKGVQTTFEDVQVGNSFVRDFVLEPAPKPAEPVITANITQNTYDKLQITIEYPITPSEPVIKEYRVNSGEWKSYHETLVINKNSTIEARSTDSIGNTSDTAVYSVENILLPEMGIKVFDTSGLVSELETEQESEVRVENFENEKILVGDTFAAIQVRGRVYSDLRYAFIKSSSLPNMNGFTLWNEMDDDEKYNDVVIEKQGFLNQRSYDVNHLSTMGQQSKWEQREEVFKYPIAAVTQASADIATSKGQYGNIGSYINASGVQTSRWINNTIFMKNMYIGNAYKEASKFWGYIKVPEDGDYVFGASSDDGFKGVITVGDESVEIANMFKVQGSTFAKMTSSIYLKADEYYPIYLEYFNWGGGAHFELFYKKNPANINSLSKNNMSTITKEWFYPSKNISPGEFSNTIFKGNKGVNFPKESGDYYLVVGVFEQELRLREVLIGPFTVDGDSSVFVTKSFLRGDMAEEEEAVELRYVISPDKIYPRGSLKENGEYRETIRLDNIRLEEEIPEDFDVLTQGVVESNGKISFSMEDIVYTLKTVNGESFYEAESIEKIISFSSDSIGSYIIGGDNSFVTFRDVNGSNRQIELEEIDIEILEKTDMVSNIIKEFEENIYAGEVTEIKFKVQGEETLVYSSEEEIDFQKFIYEEKFASGIEIVEYPNGFTLEGSIDEGFTLKGTFVDARLEKVENKNNRYKVVGEFRAKINFKYPGDFSFKKGKIDYEVNNQRKGIAYSESYDLTVKPEKFDELRVLEIQPNNDFEVVENDFQGLVKSQSGISVDRISIKKLNSRITDIQENYDIIYIGKNGEYSNIGREATGLPQGNNSKGSYAEFYSGVDITNRKANEIIDYIESGGLVFIEDGIFDDQDLKITKKLKQYQDSGRVIEIANYESIKINLEENLNTYSKRPLLEVSSSPGEYDGSEGSYNTNKHMGFVFDIKNYNIIEGTENSTRVKLYLDINGDGLFDEEENVKSINQLKNGKGYTMQYEVSHGFSGVMPWKLLIEDTMNLRKNSISGYTAFKGAKQIVRVLHLLPKKGSNLRLTNSNGSFTPPLNTEMYEIKVQELPVNIFDDNFPNDVSYEGKEIKTKLNGNYDMVIFGFGDVYGGSDLKKNASVEGVKDFIRTGQSVMFTHDTFMYHTKKIGSECYRITNEFRDISGQSIYRDETNQSELDLEGNRIPHLDFPDSSKLSEGFTDPAINRAEGKGFKITDTAVKVNDSLITKYPYIIPDEIEIADTHYQYFKLNLEDESVVPWFNIDVGGESSEDSLNYYYTYSKGNITYSGTGHSSAYGLDEQRLFVNTMLKAVRNSNRAPEIQLLDIFDGKIFAKGEERIQFSFVVSDLDGDQVKAVLKIDDSEILRWDYGEIINDEIIEVEISKKLLESVISDEDINIKFLITDKKGAESSGEVLVKWIDFPHLLLDSGADVECLVGDVGTFNLMLRGVNSSSSWSGDIVDIDYSMTYDNQSVQLLKGDTWTNISNISFGPNPNPESQSKLFSYKVLKEGDYMIRSSMDYDYLNSQGVSAVAQDDLIIKARKGIINISLVNGNETRFGEAEIRVVNPRGEVTIVRADENGFAVIENCITGRYTIDIINLSQEYYVIDGNERSFDLSYQSNVVDVLYKVVDTRKTGMHLEAQVQSELLIGDKVDLRLQALVFNQNDRVSTVFHEIELEVTRNTAFNLKNDDYTWRLEDISVNGSSQTINIPVISTILQADKEGSYSVNSSISYEYFGGIEKVVNNTKNISIRNGVINILVENSIGDLCSDVQIILRRISDGEIVEEAVSDDTGRVTFTKVPSGDYEIIAPEIQEFGETGFNKKVVKLNYHNHKASVKFKSSTDRVIINSGLFEDGSFIDSDKVVWGIIGEMAAEFKTLGENVDLKLEIDENITQLEFEILEIDENGEMEYLDRELRVENEQGVRLDTDGKVDLNDSSNRSLIIDIGQSDKVFNHYVLVYFFKQKGSVGTSNRFTINLDDTLQEEDTIEVIEMPVLD